MSFAVLAWGGCGTHWLARELGKAPGWRVVGEAAPNDQRDLMRRYEHGGERYGEVNVTARNVVHFAAVSGARIVAVERRDRFAQLRSAFRRNGWAGPSAAVMLVDYERVRAAIELHRRAGGAVFAIEDLVNPRTDALRILAVRLGVTLDLAAVDWSPERPSPDTPLDPDAERMLREYARARP